MLSNDFPKDFVNFSFKKNFHGEEKISWVEWSCMEKKFVIGTWCTNPHKFFFQASDKKFLVGFLLNFFICGLFLRICTTCYSLP